MCHMETELYTMVETAFQLEPVKENVFLYEVIQFKKNAIQKCYSSIWSLNFGSCSENKRSL